MATRDDEESSRIDLTAVASGDSRIFMVGKGSMKFVHNAYQQDTVHPKPLDLLQMRAWIDFLYRDLQQREGHRVGTQRRAGLVELDHVRRGFGEEPGPEVGRDYIRRLLASGVVEYLGRASSMPTKPPAEQIVIDLLVFALWVLVQMPKLPPGWQSNLASITSPRMAHLVAEARKARSNRIDVSPERFTRTLVSKSFGSGLTTFLEDLNSPRRGGAALAALALAGCLPKPPSRGGAKATLKWVLLGATGGAVATNLDEIMGALEDLVHRMVSAPKIDPPPFSGGGSHQVGHPFLDPFTR